MTRPRVAAGLAVGLALGAVAVVRTQSAQAHEAVTPYAMSCNVAGTATPVSTSITTSHTPESIKAGDNVTLNVKTAPPTGITLDVPVTSVGITIPIPAQVDLTSAPTVHIMGGNLTGSFTRSGSNLRITLTGNVSSLNIQLPELMIMTKLKTGIEGQTVNWPGPSNLDITANFLGVPINVACTSVATNPPVAVTPIAGATTTTPAPTTTTTRPVTTTTQAPTTTRPATTTTRPATTTTQGPTTTTTRPATTTTQGPTTTTTRPATTTTARPATTTTMRPPTTTRPPTGGPLDFFRRLLCRLFRIGC